MAHCLLPGSSPYGITSRPLAASVLVVVVMVVLLFGIFYGPELRTCMRVCEMNE